VQLFVEVDDCAAFVQSAVDKGARVLVPPQVLPGGETMAVLRDPAGMSFGIMSGSGG
jgi:predicted enzyme related to lactoylglutathione lyase